MVKSHNPRLLSLPDEQLVALGNTLGRQCPESMQAALAAYLDWATHEAKDVQTTQSLSQGLWQLDLASRLTSDPALLLSALLAPAVMHQIISTEKLENLMGEHGASVAKLMHGFERMSLLDAGAFSGDHGASHAQKMRKMLLAMVDDVRVVTLKLIERLRVMTYLREYPESEHLPTAEAVMWFYAPLANRLGLWSFKWPLEDLAFRHIDPQAYLSIAESMNATRIEREEHVEQMIRALQECLGPVLMKHAQVSGRAKHLYSIDRKMKSKQLSFADIQDIIALRVLVNDVEDCYRVLSEVHAAWTPLTESFDDYIAVPKPNGYQSLHTVVDVADVGLVEIQIRSFAMHSQAELGVASHWQYKEGGEGESQWASKVALLRELMAWQQELGDKSEQNSKAYRAIFADRVYAFTPHYDVIDLPKGATILDFAYQVHSQVGHACRGAKINGRIVPLTSVLQTGEVVSVLTHKMGKPSRDWLRDDMGYVTTSRARAKIAQWFRAERLEEHTQLGKQLLQKELKRTGITQAQWQQFYPKLGFKSKDHFYASIGRGESTMGSVVSEARRFLLGNSGRQPLLTRATIAEAVPAIQKRVKIREAGGQMLTFRAGCCLPNGDDAVKGVLTASRGLSVHRVDCANLDYLSERYPEKIIEIDWC